MVQVQNADEEVREVSLSKHNRSRVFKTAYTNVDTYKELKDDVEKEEYKKWYNDEAIEFFIGWLTRNETCMSVMASEIISPLVTKSVQRIFSFDFTAYETQRQNRTDASRPGHPLEGDMRNLYMYLQCQLDLLSKKFVIFTHNDSHSHWWGWVAINPWYQIAKLVESRQKGDNDLATDLDYCVSGLLPCDGYDQHKTYEDTSCFIWFLNLASAYRDMSVEGVLEQFDYKNHTPKSFWILGCRGPFGIIKSSQPDMLCYPMLSASTDTARPLELWCYLVFVSC